MTVFPICESFWCAYELQKMDKKFRKKYKYLKVSKRCLQTLFYDI